MSCIQDCVALDWPLGSMLYNLQRDLRIFHNFYHMTSFIPLYLTWAAVALYLAKHVI